MHQKVVSHVEDNQRNIWWDPTGRFLGPGWVRNGPIALLKCSEREKKQIGQKVNVILKMTYPYIESRNARGKKQWSSQNWSERLQTFNAPQVLLMNSSKRAAYKENLMREGLEVDGGLTARRASQISELCT